MANIERVCVHVSVALTPEEWHHVLIHLRVSPDLERLILDQLTDTLGLEYSGQLAGNRSGEDDEREGRNRTNQTCQRSL